jgi:hypothetical protein
VSPLPAHKALDACAQIHNLGTFLDRIERGDNATTRIDCLQANATEGLGVSDGVAAPRVSGYVRIRYFFARFRRNCCPNWSTQSWRIGTGRAAESLLGSEVAWLSTNK